MFGLFDKKYHNPELLKKIEETQERWFVFLDKLEDRMDEMCMAALPELREVRKKDDDPYKRAQGHLLSGINGQINQMRQKANEVKAQSIFHFIDVATAELPDFISLAGREYHDKLLTFRLDCINRHNIFEEKIAYYMDLLKKTSEEGDLENVYQEQLAEFEKIKDKFSCKQCGGKISFTSMFFISTYVNCPFCHTQNTFMPSTGAQMVLHIARDLAERRTAGLLKQYEEKRPKDTQLYKQYLRAMFDEWNKILPHMATENEKFHQRLLDDHLNSINHY